MLIYFYEFLVVMVNRFFWVIYLSGWHKEKALMVANTPYVMGVDSIAPSPIRKLLNEGRN